MKSDSLLKKYKKAMRSKQSASEQERKKVHQNYVSRLFFRIFLSSLILLTFVLADRITLKKTGEGFFTNVIQKNWNFLKMTRVLNTLFGEFVPIGSDVDVYNANIYDQVEYENGVNHIKNHTFSGVINLNGGVIIKIKKEKDDTYTVTIQGSDDYIYTYSKMKSLDYHIYNYVDAGSIIGLATEENSEYVFDLKIEKEGVPYDFYEKADDKD